MTTFARSPYKRIMPQKKSTSIYRTNLIEVGIGQGQMKTLPYLYSKTEFSRTGETLTQSTFTADGLPAEKLVWEYNQKGQVVKEEYYSEDEEPSEIVSYEFDAAGRILKSIRHYLDNSEDTTYYLYDASDHLTEKKTLDDEGETDLVETFQWDGNNLVRHEVADGEKNLLSLDEFRHDGKGNITGHNRTDSESGEEFSKVYHRDSQGRLLVEEWFTMEGDLVEKVTYETDPEGRTVNAVREGAGRNSITHYTYDEQGNNTVMEETSEEGDQLAWIEQSWDETGNLTGSVVFFSGRRIQIGQHYELSYEYEWYDEIP